jgi:hypothetical protein
MTDAPTPAVRAVRSRKPSPPPIAKTSDDNPLPSMNIKHSGDLANRLYILQADTSNTRLRV